MKILELSDIHLEFANWDEQKRFIASLDPEGIDVLVLAGDICTHKQIIEGMSLICKRFENADVVWVHGNHEYYTSNRDVVWGLSREAMTQNKNLHWLNCEAKVIRGRRFLGHTMWFRADPRNANVEWMMNDFRVISGFRDWVYQENQGCIQFLETNVTPDDIVITHHLPSPRSIAPGYKRDDLNCFYVCDMEKLIRDKGPAIWFHGHTHHSFDYTIQHTLLKSSTRVICNPRGYYPMDLNPEFDQARVIEI